MAKPSQNHMELIKVAVSLAQKRTFDHLLYVGDIPLPEEVFRGKSRAPSVRWSRPRASP